MFVKGMTFKKINDPRKYHIVDVIKDEDTRLIITKFYGIHKQWWHYEVIEDWALKNRFDVGLCYFNRRKKK